MAALRRVNLFCRYLYRIAGDIKVKHRIINMRQFKGESKPVWLQIVDTRVVHPHLKKKVLK